VLARLNIVVFAGVTARLVRNEQKVQMIAAAQFIAIVATTIFAGAAIYINLVEHPARMACSTELAATEWAPSHRRATLMQAPLALAGFFAGLLAWWPGAGLAWLVGTMLILAVIPFTLIVIKPAIGPALFLQDQLFLIGVPILNGRLNLFFHCHPALYAGTLLHPCVPGLKRFTLRRDLQLYEFRKDQAADDRDVGHRKGLSGDEGLFS
jgi:hypothetical protein